MNIDKAITYAESIVRKSLNYFYDCFPTEQSENLVFKKFENVSWTTGFYEGILWLMYELTGDKAFYNSAKHHSEMFHKRLVDRVELEHHDMGFLFTLSSVADYKITEDEQAKQDGIEAAEWLLKRYQPKGKFIQAWGSMDDAQNYRFIVDCMLNIPLLFWASEVTGNRKYYDAAYNHMKTSIANMRPHIIRFSLTWQPMSRLGEKHTRDFPMIAVGREDSHGQYMVLLYVIIIRMRKRYCRCLNV